MEAGRNRNLPEAGRSCHRARAQGEGRGAGPRMQEAGSTGTFLTPASHEPGGGAGQSRAAAAGRQEPS